MEHAEYFQSGLYQLRRKLTSIRDSFASSLWGREFKSQLEIFPECEVVTIEPENFCDVCRRGAAISTRQMYLSGNRYDKGYEVRVMQLVRVLDLLTFLRASLSKKSPPTRTLNGLTKHKSFYTSDNTVRDEPNCFTDIHTGNGRFSVPLRALLRARSRARCV
jgi:hypothetical protein